MVEIKEGDVVTLNSGGIKMTVDSVNSAGNLNCVWFNEDVKKMERITVSPKAVTKQ